MDKKKKEKIRQLEKARKDKHRVKRRKKVGRSKRIFFTKNENILDELDPFFKNLESIINLLEKFSFLNVFHSKPQKFTDDFKEKYFRVLNEFEYGEILKFSKLTLFWSDFNSKKDSIEKRLVDKHEIEEAYLNPHDIVYEGTERCKDIFYILYRANINDIIHEDSDKSSQDLFFKLNRYFDTKEIYTRIAINLCRDIVYLDENLDKIIGRRKLKFDRKKDKNKSIDVIDSSQLNILDIIHKKYKENKSEIVLDSVFPLMGQVEFYELVIDNQISFYSINEPVLSRDLCTSLNKLSEKKGFRKAGNTNAGINTIEPANEFAKIMGPILEQMDEDGIKTLRAKAEQLNIQKIKTLRNKEWSSMTVKRTLDRWKKLKEKEVDNNKIPSKVIKPK